ncbi:exocyst complex component EXO70B1-like [Abrus precatorius]|uniref:Exocyst subunit Exo70 family protein n=1 Tax=Abrus precatorius TaxID=3816 RepID=A0A8B8KLH4_ABRPR|nr:exocyst complex component EXO70B1-like [Abrus precatorius]
MENLALDIILQWDSEEARQKMIFGSHRQEAEHYLQAVDEIQSFDDQSAIPIAMARLENEFHNILISHTIPTSFLHHLNTEEKEIQNSCGCFRFLRSDASEKRHDDDDKLLRFGDIPYDAINDLRCIAERMISSGYLGNCVHVYASVRKSVFVATLQRLGIGDVQLPLEAKIQRWTEASTVCVRTLFSTEKSLCEDIFDGVGPEIDHACFMETVKEPAIQLLNYADATCISSPSSPHMLFMILDLYETLADFDIVFDFKSCESIRVMTAEVLPRLVCAVRNTLSLFEITVFQDTSKVVVPGGAIHPITTYVMNYLKFISDYKQSLNKLIVSKPSFSPDLMNFAFITEEEEGKTPLAIHLIWIIEILQFNLDVNSKQYKDSSLSHLFMMNNVHCIVNGVKRCSDLREMIGDNYLRKLIREVQKAATRYERATWGRVLDCLKYEGLYAKKGRGFSKSAVRKRIKRFNAMFKKVHKTQAVWSIPDSQLREDLKNSILQKLIPAYRIFVGFQVFGDLLGNYFKYFVQDLQAAVLDLFEGIPVSQH